MRAWLGAVLRRNGWVWAGKVLAAYFFVSLIGYASQGSVIGVAVAGLMLGWTCYWAGDAACLRDFERVRKHLNVQVNP